MNKYIEELESDDELPMDYNEVPATPAYQLENRFDVIQFKWIYNTNKQTLKKESNALDEIKIPQHSILSPLHHEPILKKGVINKQDLYCIKSVEGYIGTSTFIWLINFLLYKDLQANYLFLKSCLVSSI